MVLCKSLMSRGGEKGWVYIDALEFHDESCCLFRGMSTPPPTLRLSGERPSPPTTYISTTQFFFRSFDLETNIFIRNWTRKLFTPRRVSTCRYFLRKIPFSQQQLTKFNFHDKFSVFTNFDDVHERRLQAAFRRRVEPISTASRTVEASRVRRYSRFPISGAD